MTDLFANILESRRFHLDEDKLPGTVCKEPPAHLSTGRQITVNRRGRWVCAVVQEYRYGGKSFLTLATTNQEATQGSQFPELIYLLGQATGNIKPLFESKAPMFGRCSLTIDAADRLTIFVEEESGIYTLSADASEDKLHDALSRREAWSAPSHIAPAGSKIGDVVTDESGKWCLYYNQDKTVYELAAGGSPRKVCEQAIHPSVHIDAQGVRHLAVERDRMIFYTRRTRDGQWSEPKQAAQFCASWPCIGVSNDGQVVIVYQGEGKADLRRFPALYGQLRDAGGTTISYAILRPGQERWSHHDLVKSKNITLRRRVTNSLQTNRPASDLTRLEEFWRPGLAIDKHGVLWLFYANTTRRHVFWSRFGGENFGTPHEARGAFDNLSRFTYVQKESRGYNRIGYMAFASEQLYFDAIDVPEYQSTQARRVVFLDNLEVDQMVGIEHRMGQWKPHPEPLWGWGISGDTYDDNIVWANVNKTHDGFEMQYAAFGSLYCMCLPGRAVSKDGLRWERRDPLDWRGMTLDGKKDFSNFWRPIYLEDKDEKDPKHRYKGMMGYWTYLPFELRKYIVVTSPDKVNWTTYPGLDPVASGDISIPQHIYRDDEDPDPSRRYKFMVLCGSHSGRSMVVCTSPDLIHWSKVNFLREDPDDTHSPLAVHPTGPIAIDPDASENPYEEEVHDAYSWRENGILMFHYDAFRFHANQHIEKALAMSRDGRHYWRVRRGELNMPGGAVGSFYSGRARTSVPVRVGDELWLYFCGMPASYFTDADDPPESFLTRKPAPTGPDEARQRMVQRPWRLGLAKLRADGWGYLQLQRDAMDGQVTTIPFDYKGGKLVVNGAGLGGEGMTVELRTEDNKTVPGFEGKKSRFSSPDSVHSFVTWEGSHSPAAGRYRLRFNFQGLRSKLYAFGFEKA